MFSKEDRATVTSQSTPRWAAALAVALRLLILPGVGLLGMLAVEPFFPYQLSPVMRAVVVLNWASPAANNCVVLCQRMGLGELAECLAAMYVPMYLLCLITVPSYMS